MTIEELRAHIGCLIRIKTELYWYRTRGGVGWDGISERFCILLDVAGRRRPIYVASDDRGRPERCLHLLIDGHPQWVGLNKKHFELVK